MSSDENPGGGATETGRGEVGSRERATPLLEWLVAVLGALLVGGAIVFLVYQALTRNQTPPDIRVVAEQVLELGGGYLVQFRAFNEGGSAAAQVTIEGELVQPDGTSEVGEAVLDYLPPSSDREGGLLFDQNPETGELRLRAKGYARP